MQAGKAAHSTNTPASMYMLSDVMPDGPCVKWTTQQQTSGSTTRMSKGTTKTHTSVRLSRRSLTSNENKMSDGGRERASLGVEVWKSSQELSVRRSAVRSIAWLDAVGIS